MKVVSLGCGLGGGLQEFLKRGGEHFGDHILRIPYEQCLGIDKDPKFKDDITGQEFLFQAFDYMNEDPGVLALLPETDYYLAWNCLHMSPSKEWANALVQVMMHKARKGVWVRLLSFENDEATGEGVLQRIGLRFAWTKGDPEPLPYTLKDCVDSINEYKKTDSKRNCITGRVKPGKRLRSTDDPKVVPISAPPGVTRYEPKLGFRRTQGFVPPLVAEWEIIINV